MKILVQCLLAMILASLWGCSYKTGILNPGSFPEITNDDYATLYMYRESKLYGVALADPIQVNGVQLFRIGSGDCVTLKMPTGPSEVIFVPQWKKLNLVFEKGKKYYFYLRIDSGPSGADFRLLTEEEWNEKQKACDWVELKKEKE